MHRATRSLYRRHWHPARKDGCFPRCWPHRRSLGSTGRAGVFPSCPSGAAGETQPRGQCSWTVFQGRGLALHRLHPHGKAAQAGFPASLCCEQPSLGRFGFSLLNELEQHLRGVRIFPEGFLARPSTCKHPLPSFPRWKMLSSGPANR